MLSAVDQTILLGITDHVGWIGLRSVAVTVLSVITYKWDKFGKRTCGTWK
jgi:hypothetical protein